MPNTANEIKDLGETKKRDAPKANGLIEMAKDAKIQKTETFALV